MKRFVAYLELLWPGIAFTALVSRIGVAPQAYDAGELAAAAFELGASHPPGQVLHALVGHAATLVPFGNVTFRLSVMEALLEVLAARAVLGILLRALPHEPSDVERLGALFASVGTLLAPALLRQACRVEVYGLALVLALESVRALVAWVDGDARAVRRAALLAGLAFAAHPPHALFPLALGAVGLLVRSGPSTARSVLLAAVSCSVGLSVLAYIPLRAARGAPMWGDGTTAEGIFAYLSGAAYTQNLSPAKGGLGDTLVTVLGVSAEGTSYVPVLAMLAFVVLAVRETWPARTRFLVCMVPIGLAPALLQPLRESNPDALAYLGPLTASLFVTAALGLLTLTRALGTVPRVLALAMLLNPLAMRHAGEATHANVPALETFAGGLTDAPATRALVVVESDFVASTWWVTRAIDGTRPDVAVFVTGLATSSWHWNALAHHPAFTGVPQRGLGPDARAAFTDGAIRTAIPKVLVFVEPSWPTGGRGLPRSVYLSVSSVRDPQPKETARATSIAFFAARAMPLGDHDIAGDILRAAAIERASRLAERGRLRRAIYAATATLPPARANEATALLPRTRRAPVPLVRDPRAVLATRGDVERFVATLTDAMGHTDVAVRWLKAQVEGGDPYGLLELAFFELARDEPTRAAALVREFERLRPADREAAALLRERLPR